MLGLSLHKFSTHICNRKAAPQALGIDVLLRSGLPRMVSLRPCQIGSPSETRLKVAKIESISKPPTTVAQALEDHRTNLSDSDSTTTPAIDMSNVTVSISGPDPLMRPVNRKVFEGPVFQNVGEALFAIVEMRRRIREENLDLPATVDLVMTLRKRSLDPMAPPWDSSIRKGPSAQLGPLAMFRRSENIFTRTFFSRNSPPARQSSCGMPKSIRF